MRKRPLGRTGLSVSELGFGCAGFWARPLCPERDARAVLEHAIARGITFFDTAPSYGAGTGERRLGAVLRSMSDTSGLIVSSKVGTLAAADGRLTRDMSPATVRTSVRQSLDRLRRDRIDVLHLHGPSSGDLTPELYGALADLTAEGLIGHLGLTTWEPEVLRLALASGRFGSVMVEYNLIRKRHAALIAEAAAGGAGVVAIVPLARALYRRNPWPTSLKTAWEFARALLRHCADVVAARRYGFLNDLAGMTAAQAALAFVLRRADVSTAVVGTTSLRHLDENIAATGMALPPELTQRIEAIPDP